MQERTPPAIVEDVSGAIDAITMILTEGRAATKKIMSVAGQVCEMLSSQVRVDPEFRLFSRVNLEETIRVPNVGIRSPYRRKAAIISSPGRT